MLSNSNERSVDTSLACVVLVARFYHVAADPAQIHHHFGSHNRPLDETVLIRATRHLQLKAKAVTASVDKLDKLALLAIAEDKNGGYFILARAGEGKVLIQDPLSTKPEMLTEDELSLRWSGRLLMVTRRSVIPGMSGKFDISWFVPSIIKYKKILIQVLIASFFIQLFALITPLFFQVIIQKARYKQLNASVQLTQNQIDTLASEQRKNNLIQLQDTQLQIAGLEQDLIKATERNQQQLISPISGQVQQLAVHTIGGVVTPAQALMVIVPKQSQVEMDALILNKDIGFVHEGQKAAVKIDTFNFTKYGLIDAEILTISDDAIQDENLGLVYSARIKLHQDGLQIDDHWVKLSPGMSATSEIKTGKRRLIEYFLSPLLRYKQESVRER